MSKYPDAFSSNCKTNKDIFIENSIFCKTNNTYNLFNNQLSPFTTEKKKNCTYKSPDLSKVVSDNKIIENDQIKHSWSNQRGYGNINIESLNKNNDIYLESYKYNRIFPLTKPFYTNVDTKQAWSNN